MFALSLLLYANSAWSQNFQKTMKLLPGTGQITSYTSTYGEDADYNINPPFFKLNGDGTVTDTVTGLMWQQTDGGEMTVESAISYCDTLALGGYSNWRLPNCHESFSILHHDKPNPAIDTRYFTKTNAEYWWSSDRQLNDVNKIWVTNAGGGVGNHAKTETISAGGTKRFHVRAVRDVQSPEILSDHFVKMGNGITIDKYTGLSWLQAPLPDSLTWENALLMAENLSFGNYDDWRMPDIKELQSINSENFMNPSLDQNYFPGVRIGKYWASTSLPNQTSKAWYLDTRFGITTYESKTNKLLLLCVRGNKMSLGFENFKSIDYSVQIFPNPTSHSIKIKCSKTIDLINISDNLGRIIAQIFPQSNELIWNFEEQGIYCITIFKDGNRISKFINVIK